MAPRPGVLAVAAAIACLWTTSAMAQCSPQRLMKPPIAGDKATSGEHVSAPVQSDLPVWKTIMVGTFANSFALRNELDAESCGVGNGAAEILARPAFVLQPIAQRLDLVSVTAEQLGLATEAVPLKELYARAEQFGLELAPAEAGPQLRLQYPAQPVGEFLIIGMRPLTTWSGESLIFVVANGGAGLHLLSQSARGLIYWKAVVLFARRRHDQGIALGR